VNTQFKGILTVLLSEGYYVVKTSGRQNEPSTPFVTPFVFRRWGLSLIRVCQVLWSSGRAMEDQQSKIIFRMQKKGNGRECIKCCEICFLSLSGKWIPWNKVAFKQDAATYLNLIWRWVRILNAVFFRVVGLQIKFSLSIKFSRNCGSILQSSNMFCWPLKAKDRDPVEILWKLFWSKMLTAAC